MVLKKDTISFVVSKKDTYLCIVVRTIERQQQYIKNRSSYKNRLLVFVDGKNNNFLNKIK